MIKKLINFFRPKKKKQDFFKSNQNISDKIEEHIIKQKCSVCQGEPCILLGKPASYIAGAHIVNSSYKEELEYFYKRYDLMKPHFQYLNSLSSLKEIKENKDWIAKK